MDELTTASGIVAVAAAVLALVATVWAIVLTVKIRKVRRSQSLVLGEKGERDIIDHAVGLQGAVEAVQQFTEDVASETQRKLDSLQAQFDGCIAHRALVRYDAYNEMSGQQSSSLALLDSHKTGVVISSILHRDQARFYIKQLVNGQPEYELSPEEDKAVQVALASGPGRDNEPGAGP